ncbi:MAG: beta-ketoacyl-[acyl-carrier-protein] synthase family protein [Phycisphaerae bacterium]
MPDGQGVTITGVGLVLPTGTGLPAADAVFAGRSAVRRLNGTVDLAGAIGAPASAFAPPPDTDGQDRAVQMAAAAADEAWRGARLDADRPPADRVAVLVSLSKGGVFALSRWAQMAAHMPGRATAGLVRPCQAPAGLTAGQDPPWHTRGQARAGAAAAGAGAGIARADPSAAGRFLAARFGAAGPIVTPVTACASGGHALAWAAGLIRRGTVDVALVGAAEASLHPLVLGGYRRMGVLAGAGSDPATAVRPFSATRRGFAVGEGAGVLVLESSAAAARRGASPLARLTGWATGCHGAGLTDTETDGRALARLIRDALARAGTAPGQVDYVHAHGTATRANDVAEARAVRAALGPAADRVSVSSTKGSHGHLLGAAAAVETVLTVLAIGRSSVPPTANLTDPDPAIDLDCTPLQARPRRVRRAVKVAAGFGGQMVALVLAAPQRFKFG